MELIRNWILRIAVLLLVLGVPFFALGGYSRITAGADAVSSATAEAFDPDSMSGEYVVLINEAVWHGSDDISDWTDFFMGKPTDLLMDDVRCMVASEDPAALEYAKACQNRLPANQMKLTTETGILVMSKADAGRFATIILSQELADRYDISSVTSNPQVKEIHVTFTQEAATIETSLKENQREKM